MFDDEEGNGDLVKRRAAFKNWITARLRNLESKYKSGRFVEELAQLFVLTNDFNVVDLEDVDQRHFIVVQMDPGMKGDKDYFAKLAALVKSEEFATNWFKFLMSRDLSRYDRYTDYVPTSSIMMNQLMETRPPCPSFIFNRFLTSASPEAIVHCLDPMCRGNVKDGYVQRHVSNGLPCSNKRIPSAWKVSWTEDVKIPRLALRSEYEAWRSSNSKYKPPTNGNDPYAFDSVTLRWSLTVVSS